MGRVHETRLTDVHLSFSSSSSLSSLEKEENRGDGGDSGGVCLAKCGGDVKRKRQLCRESCPCAIETSLHIIQVHGFEEEDKPALFRCTPALATPLEWGSRRGGGVRVGRA